MLIGSVLGLLLELSPYETSKKIEYKVSTILIVGGSAQALNNLSNACAEGKFSFTDYEYLNLATNLLIFMGLLVKAIESHLKLRLSDLNIEEKYIHECDACKVSCFNRG